MADVVIREWTDEKGWTHRIEIPLLTFLREHNFESVVRCKDCKWCKPINGNAKGFYKNCFKFEIAVHDDGFCAWGNRREDGQTD